MTNATHPWPSRTATEQGPTQEAVDRMPHERDESADSQSPALPAAQEIGRMAHGDLARGLPDTSRGAETDTTYRRLRDSTPA